jgi:hypothetical protein
MAIKVRSSQVELADTFDFAPSGSVLVATPTQANQAANKAYVDAQIPDAFSGGDGIAIDDSGDPDVISVDLTTAAGLEFSGGKLQAKIKSESGGSITRDADGLYIADAAIGNAKLAGSIANAKLANSTISGKALGTSLDALTDGNGIADFTYDGSGAASIALDLDGSTLSVGASGVKVADNGIAEAQLADDCVTSAQVADGAINANSMLADSVITGPKLAVQPHRAKFTGNNSTTAFTVSNKNVYTGGEDGLLVFRNGILIEGVESSPSGQDQYTAANSGSDLVITFGTAPSTGDVILFVGLLLS